MVEEGLDRDTIVDQVWWMRAKAALLEGLPLLLLYSLSEKKKKVIAYGDLLLRQAPSLID